MHGRSAPAPDSESDDFEAEHSDDSGFDSDMSDGPAYDGAAMASDELVALASNGNSGNLFRILLDSGIDPDIRDKDGDTALIESAFSNAAGVVQLLLSAGASAEALAASHGATTR